MKQLMLNTDSTGPGYYGVLGPNTQTLALYVQLNEPELTLPVAHILCHLFY